MGGCIGEWKCVYLLAWFFISVLTVYLVAGLRMSNLVRWVVVPTSRFLLTDYSTFLLGVSYRYCMTSHPLSCLIALLDLSLYRLHKSYQSFSAHSFISRSFMRITRIFFGRCHIWDIIFRLLPVLVNPILASDAFPPPSWTPLPRQYFMTSIHPSHISAKNILRCLCRSVLYRRYNQIVYERQ